MVADHEDEFYPLPTMAQVVTARRSYHPLRLETERGTASLLLLQRYEGAISALLHPIALLAPEVQVAAQKNHDHICKLWDLAGRIQRALAGEQVDFDRDDIQQMLEDEVPTIRQLALRAMKQAVGPAAP